MKTGNTYNFGYVRFGEIESFKKNQTAFYQQNSSFWTIITDCPDTYDTFPCLFYITNQDNKIVCSLRSYPDTIYQGDRFLPWAWLGNVFTEEAYRGQGLFTMLAEESRKALHANGLPFAGVSANDQSIYVYHKLGYNLIGYGSRFIILKTIRPFIAPWFKSKIIPMRVGKITKPFFSLIFRYLFRFSSPVKARYKIDMISYPLGDGIKDLPWRTMHDKRFHCSDNVERLFWKVRSSNLRQENKTSLYVLFDVNSRKPLCYFAIRLKNQTEPLAQRYVDFLRMTLMDFGLFKDDPEIYKLLLNQVMRVFWTSDAEVLDVISSIPVFDSILRQRGMMKVGRGESFVISLPSDWTVDPDIYRLDKWHFTHFIGESFTF
jgi:hypothetical protein